MTARGLALVAFAVTLYGQTTVAQTCTGDCDGDGIVRVNELVTGVDILLGVAPFNACQAILCSGGFSINCLIESVANALLGCRTPTATPTPALTCTVSVTPTVTQTPTITRTPTPTRTCPSAPPPATCPADQVVACADQLCSIDCSCGTVTETPTHTRTPSATDGATATATRTPCNHDPTGTPTKTTDCSIAPDNRPCVHPCGNGLCFQGTCIGECTPPPTATATRTPTVLITYRLVDGSTLLITPSTGAPAVPEPLSGTLTVGESEIFVPNTFFDFNIMRIDFHAEGYAITADSRNGDVPRLGCDGQIGIGCVEASTLYSPPTQLYAFVSINGESIKIGGFGPHVYPALNLELCGGPSDQPPCSGPYHVTLFATPED